MKISTTIGLALCVGAAAIQAHAGTDTGQQLTECKQELKQLFGESTRTRLYSVKSGRNPSLVLIVSVPEQPGQRVICKAQSEGGVQLMDGDGVALESQRDNGDQITAAH